jgi:hypothetical protein
VCNTITLILILEHVSTRLILTQILEYNDFNSKLKLIHLEYEIRVTRLGECSPIGRLFT